MKGLIVPEYTEDYSADPVELFFDLAFVFAFSQIVAHLVHHPDWTGAGEAALIMLLLWLPWSQFTWSANAVPGNNRIVRVIFLIATAASVPMAAAVTTAFDEGGKVFAIPLGMISLLGVSLLIVGAEAGTEGYQSVIRYSIPTIAGFVTIIVGGFLDGEARVIAWILGIAVFVGSALRAGGDTWAVRAGHFAERHGLILIVALGEVIVAIASPLVDSLQEGEGLQSSAVLALTSSGVFAGLLWWAYFDLPQPSLEHRLEELPIADKGRFARDTYTFFHIPIVGGVIASAAALEEITLHPQDPIPLEFRIMMCVGLLMFFGGTGGAAYRAWRAVSYERALGGVAAVALLLLAADLDGVVMLLLIDALVLVVLVVGNVRIARFRARSFAT